MDEIDPGFGFYLGDDDRVYYVDPEGFEYRPNPLLEPATADLEGIRYVRCDQGIYYYVEGGNQEPIYEAESAYVASTPSTSHFSNPPSLHLQTGHYEYGSAPSITHSSSAPSMLALDTESEDEEDVEEAIRRWSLSLAPLDYKKEEVRPKGSSGASSKKRRGSLSNSSRNLLVGLEEGDGLRKGEDYIRRDKGSDEKKVEKRRSRSRSSRDLLAGRKELETSIEEGSSETKRDPVADRRKAQRRRSRSISVRDLLADELGDQKANEHESRTDAKVDPVTSTRTKPARRRSRSGSSRNLLANHLGKDETSKNDKKQHRRSSSRSLLSENSLQSSQSNISGRKPRRSSSRRMLGDGSLQSSQSSGAERRRKDGRRTNGGSEATPKSTARARSRSRSSRDLLAAQEQGSSKPIRRTRSRSSGNLLAGQEQESNKHNRRPRSRSSRDLLATAEGDTIRRGARSRSATGLRRRNTSGNIVEAAGGDGKVGSAEDAMMRARRRGGGTTQSRADRLSQRNLMRQRCAAAADGAETGAEQNEEELRAARIIELEKAVASLQQKIVEDGEPTKEATQETGSSKGLANIAHVAVGATVLMGRTAVNTAFGAGKLATSAGLAATQVAAGAVDLVASKARVAA